MQLSNENILFYYSFIEASFPRFEIASILACLQTVGLHPILITTFVNPIILILWQLQSSQITP